jgi:GntR family transcriptional regulator/MocR family aminotransferase
MRDWPVTLEVRAGEPVFLGIARAVADAVRDGRLRPGQALPGSRVLADALGVHRNTVLAAVRELEAEGWVETQPARGTYVTTDLPERRPRAVRGVHPASPAFELRGAVPSAAGARHAAGAIAAASARTDRSLALVGGVPDLRLVPSEVLARAYRRALRSRPSPLGYGDPRGDPRLRAAVASMLASVRGLAVGPDDLILVRGSQMGLALAARAVLAPGDVVAVESWGYRPAWEALRLAGARLVPLPVDADGLSTDALASLIARERVRAVYVTPHHQYPTTALLAPGRRLRLLDLASAHGFAVFEDDYDHEFHYEGRPVLPLASADTHGSVVYVGTLSKVVAPGLRTGFVVAPAALLARVAELRFFMDRQGDLTVERAVAELLEDGEVQRHARRMRKAYLERRDVLVRALEEYLPDTLRYRVPHGGLAIWARVLGGVDVEAWRERLEGSVVLHTAKRFAFDGRAAPFVRLGFAPLDPRELREAVRRLASAL